MHKCLGRQHAPISAVSANAAAVTGPRPLRFIQHKQEAFWFYRFLSIVYDHIGKLSHIASHLYIGARSKLSNDAPEVQYIRMIWEGCCDASSVAEL